MILKYSYCSLLLRCDRRQEDGGGEGSEGGKLQRPQHLLQEFRVSGATVFSPSPSSCWHLALLFLAPAFGVNSSFAEIIAPRLLNIVWRASVPCSSTRLPQLFIATGNVTMEDTKLSHASSQTTGPGHSVDSGTTANLVVNEAAKECIPLDTSRLSPQQQCGASLPLIAEQQLREASPQHPEDGGVAVAGAKLAGADEQGTPSGIQDVVGESVALNGSDVLLPSDDRSAGKSAAEHPNLLSAGKFEIVEYPVVNYEVKQENEPDSSWTNDSLGNGKLKGASSITDGLLKSAKQVDGVELLSTAETTLMGVLEKLISLDPTEIFKDPVDDSFAPNYSKIIKTPMCFAVMQKKIAMRQYASWRLFVEDFERICYNAMKYNQKRSRIWSAANTLLRQGKKVIEPYSELGDSLLGIRKVVELPTKNVIQHTAKNAVLGVAPDTAGDLGEVKSVASHQGGILEVEFVPKANAGYADSPVAALLSTELDSEGRERVDPTLLFHVSKDPTVQYVAAAADVRASLMRNGLEDSPRNEGYVAALSKQIRLDHMNAEIKVEILESTGSEDVRPDSRDEATECSSSFGYTQSKEDSDPEVDGFQQNLEVESELRDGNGALSSACPEEDEGGGGIDRGKKALNADWKKYRRGIEWRCRWLEVRLNELRARAQKYDRLLEERKAKKAWLTNVQPGEESSARTAQMVDSYQRGHILRRLRRKQVENAVDLDVYMARHPLFSRYDKKRKREVEDPYVEAKIDNTLLHVHSQQNLVEPERKVQDESDTEEQLVVGQSAVGGQDSMEQVLWKVEALQARVEKAKFQLSRGAPPKTVTQPLAIPKPPGHLPRGPAQASPRTSGPGIASRPPATKGRPSAGQSPGLSGQPSANGVPHKQSSAPLRRKSSDYDINNMVMPVSVGAKYVEHIKHADIWTPHWRLIDGTEAADQSLGGSSSEDTDDERFETRHLSMEISEKKHRYMLPPKRTPDGEPAVSGKGRSKSGMGKGAGKISGRSSVSMKVIASVGMDSADPSLSPVFARSIPKGKRRKRIFNATSFTSNHAQRLAAYLAEPSSSLRSPEATGASILVEDTIETRPFEASSDPIPISEPGNLNVQSQNLGDQAELKRRRFAASGLQVLANP